MSDSGFRAILLIFSWLLHYPTELRYSESFEWANDFCVVLTDICQKRADLLFLNLSYRSSKSNV